VEELQRETTFKEELTQRERASDNNCSINDFIIVKHRILSMILKIIYKYKKIIQRNKNRCSSFEFTAEIFQWLRGH
jgi:hypothetical protein